MKNVVLALVILFSYSCNLASDLTVVNNNQTIYGIVIPNNANKQEEKAAGVISSYIKSSTGVTLGIYTENTIGDKPGIYVGNTKKSKELSLKKITGEGYVHHSTNTDFFVVGGSGQGLIYGAYAFVEKFLEGRKYADEPGRVKEMKLFEIPSNYHFESTPHFVYREVYYPMSNDPEYMAWHGLHKFEDLWGLWGHSYFKLVNPSLYWKSHPEYFALENGKRKPTQICPSNNEVLKIAIADLKQRMTQNPDATYWSISAEDDMAYCQCESCAKIIKEEGGPTGPHLRFVNAIAKAFPKQTFTTLAYTYTLRAPFKTKPEPNVYVMLSTIDAYRNQPLEMEPSAATFRKALQDWGKLTDNLFVWDYTTQFTNYLAPLADVTNLVTNIKYLSSQKVKGVFSQGSGDTYGELAELKSYLIANALWNPAIDEKQLIADFYNGYYKGAGKHIEQYVNKLHELAHQSKRPIDIYGNPVNEYQTYLSPIAMDTYSTILDEAEGAAEENEKLLDKVYRVRICLDFVALQQARFYGTDKHGYLIKDENNANNFIVNPKVQTRVAKFLKASKNLGVKELSEGGLNPDAYAQEWEQIFKRGWTKNLAKDAKVSVASPFAPEYPAKREQTLTDEVYGELDYSYNWLCFYGDDMETILELNAEQKVNTITLTFLDDPRHWIFLPQQVDVLISVDGVKYTPIQPKTTTNAAALFADEHYNATRFAVTCATNGSTIKFIKVKAKNYTSLPAWRFKPNRKTMIACDEILVQ